MKTHPLAEIFPLIDGVAFDELTASIKENGLRQPITVYEDMILDGRNRYRACEAAGVEPRFETFNGADPVKFVIDLNINRRHLDSSQRAMIAARLTLANTQGRNSADGHFTARDGVTVDEARQLLNVAKETVSDARRVLTEGTPEEVAAVDRGEAAVSTLAKQIRNNIPAPERQPRKKNDNAKRNAQAEIWHHLRDALDYLTSLPLPIDVVAIANTQDKKTKGAAIDKRITPAMEWLTEFHDAWKSRNA
jgi:ParB-like nuclease domain